MPAQNNTTMLLATDLQRSVLQTLDATSRRQMAYTPYGHRTPESGMLILLGFNGELPERGTGHYLLGNGYRAFNPILMRFNSPDSLSPFGEGGLNAYAYCLGDPINRIDPNGHIPAWLQTALGIGAGIAISMVTAGAGSGLGAALALGVTASKVALGAGITLSTVSIGASFVDNKAAQITSVATGVVGGLLLGVGARPMMSTLAKTNFGTPAKSSGLPTQFFESRYHRLSPAKNRAMAWKMLETRIKVEDYLFLSYKGRVNPPPSLASRSLLEWEVAGYNLNEYPHLARVSSRAAREFNDMRFLNAFNESKFQGYTLDALIHGELSGHSIRRLTPGLQKLLRY